MKPVTVETELRLVELRRIGNTVSLRIGTKVDRVMLGATLTQAQAKRLAKALIRAAEVKP